MHENTYFPSFHYLYVYNMIYLLRLSYINYDVIKYSIYGVLVNIMYTLEYVNSIK